MSYRQRSFWRLCGVLAVPLALAGAVTAPAAGATTRACQPAPAGVLPVSPGTGNNELTGVAVLTPCNVWAVGDFSNTGETGTKTLIEHWNGTAWTVAQSPSPGSDQNVLVSAHAVSATDIWAVGRVSNIGDPGTSTLTEHWNGTAWTVVPSPNLGSAQALTAVTAVSASDAWAVGQLGTSAGSVRAFLMHWTGTKWNFQRIPSPGTASILSGVAATSRGNVWAVGGFSDGVATSTLVLHWNGTSWKQITNTPNPRFGDLLTGVGATSAASAWAVGIGTDDNSTTLQTLTLRWNGTKWATVPSPNPGGLATTQHALFGVAPISASNAWAVGQTFMPGTAATGKSRPGGKTLHGLDLPFGRPRRGPGAASGPVTRTLVLHWNGTKWVTVPGPNPGAGTTAFLTGVGASSATNVWAVGGFTGADGTGQALAEVIP